MSQRITWLAERTGDAQLETYGVKPDMWLIGKLAHAAEMACRDEANGTAHKQQLTDWGWNGINSYSKTDVRTLEGIKKRATKAASVLRRMEQTNQKIADKDALPLPTDKTTLVKYGQVSVISLAGYTGDFQATIYSMITDERADIPVMRKCGTRINR